MSSLESEVKAQEMRFQSQVRERQTMHSPSPVQSIHEMPTSTFHTRLGNPAPLAMGGFATTLMTVSLAMMNFRGVSVQTLFIGDLCFVACIGLLISAQWSMLKGDTFSYTVLTAFGLFYGGYGCILAPSMGVAESFGGYNAEYYNAMGFFILIWAVLNIFFFIASFNINVVYICVFASIEACFVLDAISQFAMADGKLQSYHSLQTAAGAFGFVASLLGYYSVAHYLCADALGFALPMGDTSQYFIRTRKVVSSKDIEAGLISASAI